MTTTHAIVATELGGPERAELAEVELAEPGEGQVTVAVRAAGVNPVDVKRLSGAFGAASLPLRLGNEIAGVVTAVGPNAVGPLGTIAVGDEVVAYPVSGGYAEAVTVSASSVLPRPRALEWGQAANLLLTGVTAWHLLEATRVAAGDRVLIHGASGGVGLTAAQLAVHRGAQVVGTASERNHELLRRYGVTPVTYGAGLADRVREAFSEGVDVALDTVGTDEALDVSVELVSDRSRVATIAGFARGAELGILLLGGGPGADPGREIRTAARPELVGLADEGLLDVVMGATFPLAEARAALELVASGHPGGQVALLP